MDARALFAAIEALGSAVHVHIIDLRHAEREALMGTVDACLNDEPLRGSGGAGVPSSADVALTVAKSEWERNVAEPPGPNWERIDEYIRGDQGLGWPSADVAHKGLGARYIEDGQFAWCGAFVAFCLGAAGLKKEVRRKVMPSTYRLWEYARGNERMIRTAKDVEAGDIVIVGPPEGARGSKRWGNHVTLARGPCAMGLIPTFEGNARGPGPDGTTHEGVIRRSRPLEGSGRAYIFRYAVRMLAEDYE